MTHPPPNISPGLCTKCCHAEQVPSARGSTFVLCRLSVSDARFPKYPRLPVTDCAGFQSKGLGRGRCIHGLDSRFCAACNRSAPSSGGGTMGRASLDEVLTFLNDEQIRATYGAVAEVVGVAPRALSAQLGPRRPEASWVVSAENELPTDYDQSDWHPALLSRGEVIKSGRELMLRMAIRRAARRG